MKELGSEVARQPEGEVARQEKKFPNQANQNQTQIMIEHGNLLFALKEERLVLRKSKHILFVKKLWNTIERRNPLFALEDETNHDRTEKPVVCRLWVKPQTCDFHIFLLFCCSWIVYRWRRSIVTDGVCKDTLHKTIFAVWISTKNSRTSQKVN